VVGDFGLLTPRQTWALCGQWPSNPGGWDMAVVGRAGLRIHDLCRYWARIGGPWLYVRSPSLPFEWHVIRDTGEESPLATALCGHIPDRNGWVRSVQEPLGLDLHDQCRAERDRLDFDH
jgi:hypothetical protein